MDPNATRDAIIWHATSLMDYAKQGEPEAAADEADNLSEAVRGLLGWYAVGGFEPAAGTPWPAAQKGAISDHANKIIFAADRNDKNAMLRIGRQMARMIIKHNK